MSFIQSIDFAIERRAELLGLMERWTADAMGAGAALGATFAEDRSAPAHFVLAVRFDSAEAAAAKSARPETGTFAEEFATLCSEGPTFREFDVVDVYGA